MDCVISFLINYFYFFSHSFFKCCKFKDLFIPILLLSSWISSYKNYLIKKWILLNLYRLTAFFIVLSNSSLNLILFRFMFKFLLTFVLIFLLLVYSFTIFEFTFAFIYDNLFFIQLHSLNLKLNVHIFHLYFFLLSKYHINSLILCLI